MITPNGLELEQALNLWGPALKPGDPAHISFVQIKSDHIRFEINGGPILRKKWYQRVQVYGANGPVAQTEAMPQTNAHGSCVDLYFDKYVPEMTAAQVRDLLYPVLDFKARNKEQAYLDSCSSEGEGGHSSASRAGGHESGDGAARQGQAAEKGARAGRRNSI